LDYSEFKCKWIDPVSLYNIVDETRNKKTPYFFYWSGRRVMFFNVPLNIFRMT